MSFLNLENIKRSDSTIEYHPLFPFLPENTKVLFLGSFPPQRKRWSMDFFYPNFINDHWRIMGLRLPILYRLPSSSRAYPLSLDKKAEAYRKMFETAGL